MTSQAGGGALAVILGRAGSKGLPGKNAMLIAGEPMICHSIRDAQQAGCVNEIVVTTDGEDIARAAQGMGVRVIHRPSELATDTATVDSAARHAVETCGSTHDVILLLYANVPVRPDDLLDRAYEKLIRAGADSVQSYVNVAKCHPYWMVRLDEDARVAAHHPNAIYRRQDLPPLYLPDGGVIAVRRESLFRIDPVQPHAFLGDDRRGIVTDPGDVVDVDHAIDARVAEAILGMAEPAGAGR